ncbi:MAG: hypothetical protein WDO16_24535 [Bacteroidota bacterium]
MSYCFPARKRQILYLIPIQGPPGPGTGTPDLPAVAFDYVGHASNIPAYIKNYINTHPGSDNTTAGNPLTNNGATLGRVLFYDKSLSVNNTSPVPPAIMPTSQWWMV